MKIIMTDYKHCLTNEHQNFHKFKDICNARMNLWNEITGDDFKLNFEKITLVGNFKQIDVNNLSPDFNFNAASSNSFDTKKWWKRVDFFDDAVKTLKNECAEKGLKYLVVWSEYSRQGDKILDGSQHYVSNDYVFQHANILDQTRENIARVLRKARSRILMGRLVETLNPSDSQHNNSCFFCDVFNCDSLMYVDLKML